MFGWDLEVDTWFRFWRWNFINICVRTWWTSYIGKLNSILGSVVPLTMFTIYFDIFFVKVETECLFYCIFCLGSVHHTVVKVLPVASLLINTAAAGQSCSIHNDNHPEVFDKYSILLWQPLILPNSHFRILILLLFAFVKSWCWCWPSQLRNEDGWRCHGAWHASLEHCQLGSQHILRLNPKNTIRFMTKI